MTLLITQDYLINNSIMDANIDYDKIKTFIEDIQDDYIEPLIGTDLYDEIIEQIEASPVEPFTKLSAANKYILDKYICKIITRYVLKELSLVSKFRVTNSGVQVRSSDDSQSADTTDVFKMSDYWKNKAESKKKRLLDYLNANRATYPKYGTKDALNSLLPQKDGYSIDMYLPDSNCSTDPYYQQNTRHGENKKPF